MTVMHKRSGSSAIEGPLDDDQIASLLSERIAEAASRDSELAETREEVNDLYMGEAIGDESDGGSTYRTREVLEMVEDALPPLLAVFLSAPTVVQFEPRTAQDVEAAAQETDVINYYLAWRAGAFLVIHNFLKSILMDPVAYCKVHCVHRPETIHHSFESLTASQLTNLVQNREWLDGAEIEELPPKEGLSVPTFRFHGTELRERPAFLVDPVPGNEVLVDASARFVDLDEVWADYGFICHQTRLTHTDLLKRGYDEAELNDLPTADSEFAPGQTTTDRTGYNRFRLSGRGERAPNAKALDRSTARYEVSECYVKLDVEGTGEAESWCIILVAGKVMEKRKVSYQPLVACSGIPMPFAHAGLSPAEAMADIQALKTRLIRAVLNDAYQNERRRLFVDRNARAAETEAQLDDPDSQYVYVKGNPNQAVMPEPIVPMADALLGTLRYADELLKRRTGMAPDVALNPDVLRDATAHGMLMSMDKQSSRLMNLARIIAETGLKKIGLKLHQLLRMYQDEATVVQVRGKWVDVNPADWNERTDMTVAVGLGFNSPQQKLMALQQLLQLQKEALAQGLATPVHIKATLERLVEASNLGFYTQFFVDPTVPGWKPPPPPPDPQMEAVKAQTMIAQGQEETKRAEIQAKASVDQERIKVELVKAEIDKMRIEADARLKKVKARMEATLLPELKLLEARDLEAKIKLTLAQIAKIASDIDKSEADMEDDTGQDSPESADAKETSRDGQQDQDAE